MFCPQCGQQQSSDVARFCARCGFALEAVTYLLRNRGLPPSYSSSEAPTEMSPRRKGVRQGGALLLTGAVLVPILGVFNAFTPPSVFLDIIVAIAAIICFVGGPLRMIFAGLFEEGAPQRPFVPTGVYAPPMPSIAPAISSRRALPPGVANPAGRWKPRPTTAELAQPPSVTENTTRLLDKEESR